MSAAPDVAIVDYGSGNLRSAARAFERVIDEAGAGASVAVTDDPDRVRRAGRVVLPGVGAFADCMRGLEAVPGMVEALDEAVAGEGRPSSASASACSSSPGWAGSTGTGKDSAGSTGRSWPSSPTIRP